MKAVFLLLCAAVALTGVVPYVHIPTRCPVDWTKIGERCYFYVSEKLNWAQAERKCQSMSANLAPVHSKAEYSSIQMVIAKASNGFGNTWIGGTDCQVEGIWLWSDGTAFDYRHCGRMDNAHGKQHCLQMNHGSRHCWDDTKCSNKRPSVCATKKRSCNR